MNNQHYELKLGINNSLKLYKSTELGFLSVKDCDQWKLDSKKYVEGLKDTG
ncbi:MAG: hypothetical protein HKN68_15380 [Saprospiraceae bacterium]|nr:hypothetical protein [Saprospiraceae bacterium]